MSWLSKAVDSVGGGASAAGIGAVLPSLGMGFVDTGLGMISSKYESDMQGHLNEEAFNREKNASVEMFNMKNAREDQVWEREKAYAAQVRDEYNKYNSPAEQMKRFEAAGLNPLLAYSQGTPGNTTVIKADALQSGNPTTPSMRPADYRAPRVSMSDEIAKYFEIRNKGLENQNLAAQNSLIQAQAKNVNEDARDKKRENDFFERIKGSKYDWYPIKTILRARDAAGTAAKAWEPNILRFGGMIGKFFKDSLLQTGEFDRATEGGAK